MQKFKCSGNITSLLLGVSVELEADKTKYPYIELWSRTPMSPIQYERVNGTRRSIILNASYFSTTGPYQYNITPPLPYNNDSILAVRQLSNSAKVKFYQVDSMHEIYKLRHRSGNITRQESKDILISPITSKLMTYLFYIILFLAANYCLEGFLSQSIIENKSRAITRVAAYGNEKKFQYPNIRIKCSGLLTNFIFGAIEQNMKIAYPKLQLGSQSVII